MIEIVLHPQLRRNILAYVDDIVVKSVQRRDHISDLVETFANLRVANLRLNPKKCVFDIHKGKVLRCLVSTKGIEAIPDKIKALIEMQDLVSVKDVQKLTGRVAALNRFILRAAERILPFSSCQKFQELLVVRNTEASFPRAQRLLVQYHKVVPSRAKITAFVICVCIKFGSKCCASVGKRRRRKIQVDPSVFFFRISLKLENLLF
jgi:hypothetical protein